MSTTPLYRPERVPRFLEDAFDVVTLGDVGDAGMALDCTRDRLGAPGIAVDAEHLCAGLRQSVRGLLADALAGAEYDKAAPGEISVAKDSPEGVIDGHGFVVFRGRSSFPEDHSPAGRVKPIAERQLRRVACDRAVRV